MTMGSWLVDVLAATPEPVPTAPAILPKLQPDSTAIPGGPQLLQLLNGVAYLALLACAAAVVVGGATWYVSNQHGNFNGAFSGRRMVIAGMIGAIVVGSSVAVVMFFFDVGAAVT